MTVRDEALAIVRDVRRNANVARERARQADDAATLRVQIAVAEALTHVEARIKGIPDPELVLDPERLRALSDAATALIPSEMTDPKARQLIGAAGGFQVDV